MGTSYLRKGLAALAFAGSMLIGTKSYSQFNREEYLSYPNPLYYNYIMAPIMPTQSRFDKRLEEEQILLKADSFKTAETLLNISKQKNKTKRKKLEEELESEKQITKYAVLINGDNEARFGHDISLIYQVLLESKFKKENIYILDQYGTEKSIYPVDTTATKENIQTLLSHLEKKIDEDDLFVMHISDHGTKVLDTRAQADLDSISNNQAVYHAFQSMDISWEQVMELHPRRFKFLTAIALPGPNFNYKDYMTEIEFEESISKIKPGLGLVTATICYGYSIIDKLDKNKFIGISASEKDKVAHMVLDESFMGYFYEAFRNSKESDLNKNNDISIEEAFNYAKLKHYYTRHCIDKPIVLSNLNITNITIK